MLHLGYPSYSNLSDVLPKLERLEYSGNLKIDFMTLTSLLCSRWDQNEAGDDLQGVAQLKSVRFVSRELGTPDPHSLTQLQDLATDGMEMMLKGNWPDLDPSYYFLSNHDDSSQS
jgi:hypothetical protein